MLCEVLERVEKQGIELGEFKMLVKLVKNEVITLDVAAKEAGMDKAAFEARMREIK